jgi:valyl-tRNA synthetase
LLTLAPWPVIAKSDARQSKEFEEVKTIVSEARFVLSALNVSKIGLKFKDAPAIAKNAALIQRLARLGSVEGGSTSGGVALNQTNYDAWLDIDESTAKAYADNLQEKLANAQRVIVQLEGRLSNKSYVDNAPEAIVTQTRAQLDEAKQTLSNITAEYERFAPKGPLE